MSPSVSLGSTLMANRLRATGVVNVENPVTRAYQEGRIQEMSDDEED